MEQLRTFFTNLNLNNVQKVVLVLVGIFILSLFVSGGTADKGGNLAAVASVSKVIFLTSGNPNESVAPGSKFTVGVPGTNIKLVFAVRSVTANNTVLDISQE